MCLNCIQIVLYARFVSRLYSITTKSKNIFTQYKNKVCWANHEIFWGCRNIKINVSWPLISTKMWKINWCELCLEICYFYCKFYVLKHRQFRFFLGNAIRIVLSRYVYIAVRWFLRKCSCRFFSNIFISNIEWIWIPDPDQGRGWTHGLLPTRFYLSDKGYIFINNVFNTFIYYS